MLKSLLLLLSLFLCNPVFAGFNVTGDLSVPNGNTGLGTTNVNIRLNVKGNVGIGTNNVNNGAILSIVGNGSGNQTLFAINTSPNFVSTVTTFSVGPADNVGIGTINPLTRGLTIDNAGSLTVTSGNANVSGSINTLNSNFSGGGGSGLGIWFSDPSDTFIHRGSVGQPDSHYIIFTQNGSDKDVINNVGNLGVGSTNPGTMLDVQGTSRTTGFQLNLAPLANGNVLVSNNVGIGTWMPPSTIGAGGSSQWTTINTNDVYLPNRGNVGIGTTLTTTSALNIMNGNVGIGTWKPTSAFQIFSSGAATASLDSNAGSQGGCIELKDYDGTGYTYLYANNGILFSTTTSCK